MRGRNLSLACAVSFLLLSVLIAAPARAAAVTMTIHVKDATMTFPAANPCTGTNATMTITVNGMFHVTMISLDRNHVAGTETGTFVLAPLDPAQPTYTGHITTRFGANVDPDRMVLTSTFGMHGVGSDGSALRAHDVLHVTLSDSGVVHFFDKPRCG